MASFLTVLWFQLGAGLGRHQAGHEAMSVLGAVRVLTSTCGADAGADGGAQQWTVDHRAGGRGGGLQGGGEVLLVLVHIQCV